jgi:hypothetical protein
MSGKPPKQPRPEPIARDSSEGATASEALTVFMTGNELGELKPCGCSGGQLGGLDRRSALFNGIPSSKRMIIDTGAFVKSDGEQDQIKFDIIVQALALLDYDLVNLTDEDLEMARNLGLLDTLPSAFNVVSSRGGEADLPAKFTKKLSLGNRNVAVSVASFDAEAAGVEQIRELFAPQPGLETANILIVNRCDETLVDSIAKMKIVDCLVCPPEDDEATVVGDKNRTPLVVSPGRLGKYVGKLQIRAADTEDKLLFTYEGVPVRENLPPEESLVELYKTYQLLVKEANLLERQPRYVLPNGLEYTGSDSCKLCHSYEYEKWSTKAHADAYATLVDVNSQYDPECIRCHVIGFEYQSGFISEQKTPHLKNVGCENCHGPGSKHIQSLGRENTSLPKMDCADCHTPEHSAGYSEDPRGYFQKIVHWREPNAPGNVK